jgi:hypothetical protein
MTTDVATNLRTSGNMCHCKDTSDLSAGNFLYVEFVLQAVDNSQYNIRAMNLNELTFVL